MSRNLYIAVNAGLKKSLFNIVVVNVAVVMMLSALSSEALAAIRLPKLVGDNMVLQRDMPLKIWGWASAGEPVAVDFHGQHAATKANDNGEWAVTLPAQHAGGPFTMTIAGKNTLTLNNILIGDVWLASGQSNMQFPLSSEDGFGGVVNEQAEINNANFPNIRLFSVKRLTSLTPVADVESAGWFETTPQSVKQFPAVGYFFGRDLYQHQNVPIGLIDSTWGGTPAETWISESTMQQFADFSAILKLKATLTAKDAVDNDDYIVTRNAWYAKHDQEDRGLVDGRNVWSEPTVDDSQWLIANVPKSWPTKYIKEFDGTLWLRKHIQVPSEFAGKPIQIRLSKMLQRDVTFFNGHEVGQTDGDVISRVYDVPGEEVIAGDNVITVHLIGQHRSGDGFVGMHGDANDMFTVVGGNTISLAGDWLFQTGPDVTELPNPPPMAQFRRQFPRAPTLLFNAMISPLINFKIKGAIWYQGESNADRPVQYRALFPALIKDWRAAWGYDLPFLFVQLAGYGADKSEPAEYSWAELREAQDMTLSLKNTGMATAVDIGDAEDIHPRNKQDVGKRLALVARKLVYHEHVVDSGPRYKSMQVQDKQIRLHFTDTGSGLMLKNGAELKGFAITGRDGKYVWAKAVIAGNDVIVSNDTIAEPTAVRYDWSNTPQGNLYNKEALPAVPFRTDRPH